MGKRSYVLAIVTVTVLLFRPASGIAMMTGAAGDLEVKVRSIEMDTLSGRAKLVPGTFLVTPEPVTAALLGFGLLGLIKLRKNRII